MSYDEKREQSCYDGRDEEHDQSRDKRRDQRHDDGCDKRGVPSPGDRRNAVDLQLLKEERRSRPFEGS